jgi:hypothetical protein
MLPSATLLSKALIVLPEIRFLSEHRLREDFGASCDEPDNTDNKVCHSLT